MYLYFIIFTISLFQFMKIEKSDHRHVGLHLSVFTEIRAELLMCIQMTAYPTPKTLIF